MIIKMYYEFYAYTLYLISYILCVLYLTAKTL